MTDGAEHEPVLNAGHVAAWGAIVAGQLTVSRTRYTQMIRDHIQFSAAHNRVVVVGGGSGILPIAWPSEARLHHGDVGLFRSEFGSPLTSFLRLGYAYRLGPIGEWIFFEPDDSAAVRDPPPRLWSEEWDAPVSELSLGNDCSLDSHELDRIVNMGARYRQQHKVAAAKRCFMRCYLAGIAAGNEVIMASGLVNLAATYLNEQRWLRVIALGVSAAMLAGALTDDARDFIVSIMRQAHTHEPKASSRMSQAAIDWGRAGQSFTEILWHLEDFEIQRALARAQNGH